MKKILLFVALVATAFCAKAQTNIQEQYDFNREHLTTTLEMFKADNWGDLHFSMNHFGLLERVDWMDDMPQPRKRAWDSLVR